MDQTDLRGFFASRLLPESTPVATQNYDSTWPRNSLRVAPFRVVLFCMVPSLMAPFLFSAKGLHAQEKPSLSVELRSTPEMHFLLRGSNLSLLGKPVDLFAVVVESEEIQNPPKLLGTYSVVEGGIRFTPRFPLSSKLRFKVLVDEKLRSALGSSQELVFELESKKEKISPAKISAVYPSQEVLPANVLKFYIHFSRPMSRGDAYEHIQLFRGDQIVDHPFLELGEELWNRDQTRFTLFVHPGRIKRGLKPREQQGPAISEGDIYQLRILPSWPDASGQKLQSGFIKTFSVSAEDHEQPSLEAWKIGTPAGNSVQPVTLTFNEPLDHGMLQRVLDVEDQFQMAIAGTVTISESEKLWSFVPDKAWKVGTYNIIVAANLEDRSGNSIARPFEVKMQKNVAAKPSTKVAIEFIVK